MNQFQLSEFGAFLTCTKLNRSNPNEKTFEWRDRLRENRMHGLEFEMDNLSLLGYMDDGFPIGMTALFLI